MSEELSPSQAAARVGATTRSVQRWIASGRLPARRVGGRWRVASDAIDALVASASAFHARDCPAHPDPHPVHRQSRRDRDAHHPDLRSARDPLCRARDRGPRRARPARCRGGRPGGHRGRSGRAPSRFRVPCRERRLRRGRDRGRDPLGRSSARGDPRHGRQGGGPPARGIARGPGPPRLRRTRRVRRSAHRGVGARRLSHAGQTRGGRRRQGHAHGPWPRGTARRHRGGQARGGSRLR